MNTIRRFQNIIDTAVEAQVYPKKPEGLYAPISYFLQLGGKRIRPVLLLLAIEMFGENYEKHVNIALAVELFHNFTLVHDDIMDNAPLRRGKDTVHAKWDINTAILSGDAMLIKAYQLLQNAPKEHLSTLLDLFNQTALEVCEGQQFDMNFEQLNTVSIAEYIHMIRLKTAVLLGCALKMGAILGNANYTDAQNLYEFGVNIGIAFQLQDDLLDAFAPSAEFGKQKGGDIIANKKTFLLLKAIELTDEQDTKILHQLIYENHHFTNEEKVNTVTQIFEKLNIPSITENEIQNYANKGLDALAKINIMDSKKESLKFLVNLLNQRVH